MIIHTIGFTQKSAERFFGSLVAAGVKRIIDTRLHNTSQLSGFAKQDDLRFFLENIGSIEYQHEPLLAPTNDILDQYKKKAISWSQYEDAYVKLIRERGIQSKLTPAALADACLLCSEAEPHHCHRRLAAEFLRDHWQDVQIHHIR
jgi:uncharacterized protein (DUF488 family)